MDIDKKPVLLNSFVYHLCTNTIKSHILLVQRTDERVLLSWITNDIREEIEECKKLQSSHSDLTLLSLSSSSRVMTFD